MTPKEISTHHSYLKLATLWANDQSYATRRKVGSMIVKDGSILSHGHNGTIPGFQNICEDENGNTVIEHILHAEANSILKVAQSTNSTKGAVMYCTDSACVDCAKLIIQSGITDFFFSRNYRGIGVDLLLAAGVGVYSMNLESGDMKQYTLLNDATIFKSENRGKVVPMDRNVVEIFTTMVFKNEILEKYRVSCFEYKNDFDIFIKLKPGYEINSLIHKFKDVTEQLEFSDGYIKTINGMLLVDKYETTHNKYNLITPVHNPHINLNIMFSVATEKSTDRSDYGDVYSIGNVPFHTIESIKIIDKVK